MNMQSNLCDIFAYLMILFLSWGNFQICGLYFFVIFQILFCIISFSNYKKFYVSKLKIINIQFICLILSTVSSMLSKLPLSYKKYSFIMLLIMVACYFSYGYLMNKIKFNENFLKRIILILKAGFLVQIVYLPIQFFAYKFLELDLNDLIFNSFFHFMENPTFFRQGVYYPSAFVWHSAVLAPMFVLSFLLFDKIWIRSLIVLDSFICGNSTALIGVILCLLFVTIHFLFIEKRSPNNKEIIGVIILISLLIVCFLIPEVRNIIFDKIKYLLNRFSQINSDSSSSAHVSYYTLYPKILRDNNIINGLFGTGYASSGFSISCINGQYSGLKHWVVESDIIDTLISKGIIGFIFYYLFLLTIAFKGSKINYKYFVFVIVIIIQGITYNVQFEYIFFIELLMQGTIYLKKDLFTII